MVSVTLKTLSVSQRICRHGLNRQSDVWIGGWTVNISNEKVESEVKVVVR